jgi:hypothetical protein
MPCPSSPYYIDHRLKESKYRTATYQNAQAQTLSPKEIESCGAGEPSFKRRNAEHTDTFVT